MKLNMIYLILLLGYTGKKLNEPTNHDTEVQQLIKTPSNGQAKTTQENEAHQLALVVSIHAYFSFGLIIIFN